MIKIDSIQQLKSTINTYSDICQISEYLYVIIFMKKEKTMSTTENLTATKSSGKAIDITLIALFAALMAICSWISIPLTVPFTLQTFAVFVTLEIIGGKRGTLSILVFLLLELSEFLYLQDLKVVLPYF